MDFEHPNDRLLHWPGSQRRAESSDGSSEESFWSWHRRQKALETNGSLAEDGHLQIEPFFGGKKRDSIKMMIHFPMEYVLCVVWITKPIQKNRSPPVTVLRSGEFLEFFTGWEHLEARDLGETHPTGDIHGYTTKIYEISNRDWKVMFKMGSTNPPPSRDDYHGWTAFLLRNYPVYVVVITMIPPQKIKTLVILLFGLPSGSCSNS